MLNKIETVARGAIVEAGALISKHIGQVSASWIHSKGPSDYVTEVDQKCERLIVERVSAHFPDHHIMAEESESEGLQPGYTWVIDPLDGTTNFIHGLINLCNASSKIIYPFRHGAKEDSRQCP